MSPPASNDQRAGSHSRPLPCKIDAVRAIIRDVPDADGHPCLDRRPMMNTALGWAKSPFADHKWRELAAINPANERG
jgi:hypothetical protein